MSDEYVQSLVKALKDKDAGVRMTAVEKLSQSGSAEARGSLMPLITEDPDPKIRQAAILAVDELKKAPKAPPKKEDKGQDKKLLLG